MKKLIVLLPVVCLSGCFYQTVSYLDVAAAKQVCEDKGGFGKIMEDFPNKTSVKCIDGTFHDLNEKVLILEKERDSKYSQELTK